MKPHLTPAEIEAAYEFLRTRRPFRRWRLPDGDDIKFKVMADQSCHAYFEVDDKTPVIGVNQTSTLTAKALLVNVAHEMIHLRQWLTGIPYDSHGAVFKKLKASVCRWNGFDPGVF